MDLTIGEIFISVFTFKNLLAISAGVGGGLVIGSLPGLTANMGVALLLPVTFSMGPIEALLMLASLYTAAIYGGSFSAILLHTPGTSASAATAIDGFELTRRGEAAKAIRIATFSSMTGGMVSALFLLLLAPPLSLISLKFGPPEYFLLAVFGLTIIGSLASGNIVKGLLSGMIGLLFSTVGMDLDSGFPRYAFGLFALHSGLNFVPAVIGLFSLSQAFIMACNVHETIERIDISARAGWRFFPTLSELKEIKTTLLRSSLIGVVVGILPGAGGDIGSWVSYNEAKRFSKHRERFGKGAIEGICASETANNAVTGSSLIPMLTLGIPGSATAAIMLGALIIQGLVPGRELFTHNGYITYTVIIGFFFANILMAVVGMLASRYVDHIARLPNNCLIPAIIILSVVGSYSLGNDMVDVYVMIAFGFFGYLMRLTGFHPAPMILGLILGPIAEKGFRQSVALSQGHLSGYFLTRPICIVMIVLILLSIVTSVMLSRKNIHMQEDK